MTTSAQALEEIEAMGADLARTRGVYFPDERLPRALQIAREALEANQPLRTIAEDALTYTLKADARAQAAERENERLRDILKRLADRTVQYVARPQTGEPDPKMDCDMEMWTLANEARAALGDQT